MATQPADSTEQTAPIDRQAVVVVHGQGEQRPMGMIRDFVKVLWQFNADLGPVPKDGRPIWIVPDDKSGLFELERVTTESKDCRKTDFFELYYADLLNDTPLRNLWRWIRRLLSINPTYIPSEFRVLWTAFWFLSLIAGALFLVVLVSAPTLFRTDWLALAFQPRAQLATLLIIFLGASLVLPKFFKSTRVLERIPRWLNTSLCGLAVVWIYLFHPLIWGAMFLLLGCYMALRYLLPYFGDAASYLSAQTETVASRQLVRNRGLRLLRALHDDPAYDRVIVVAHSLGSVLAYDLLHILWREVGPTKDNPPQNADAMREVDAYAAHIGDGTWTREESETYQALQWRAFNALRQQKTAGKGGHTRAGWKISDFVSLGTPLTSAQFLITDGHEDFALMKQQRVLPTSPPQRYNDSYHSIYQDGQGNHVAHHAAVFNAVRWTNIYDAFEPDFFLFGDPISGPVSGDDRFGRGVFDRNVRIEHGGIAPRFFTHSYYWTETSQSWAQPSDQIVALREAVGLDRTPTP